MDWAEIVVIDEGILDKHEFIRMVVVDLFDQATVFSVAIIKEIIILEHAVMDDKLRQIDVIQPGVAGRGSVQDFAARM